MPTRPAPLSGGVPTPASTSPSLSRALALFRALALSSMLAALCLSGLAGCGRPATRAECDEIFDRSAEIELRAQNITDPKIIRERIGAVRAAKGEPLINECVGKRITENAIACVRNATSSEQMDKCLE